MTTKKPTLRVIAARVDKWFKVRSDRLKFEKDLKPLKSKETELKDFLIDNISSADSGGVSGKLCRVSIGKEVIPVLDDPEKFRAYVVKTKKWELAQQLKPSATAIKEVWEAGKDVPGIKKFNIKKLNYSAIK